LFAELKEHKTKKKQKRPKAEITTEFVIEKSNPKSEILIKGKIENCSKGLGRKSMIIFISLVKI